MPNIIDNIIFVFDAFNKIIYYFHVGLLKEAGGKTKNEMVTKKKKIGTEGIRTHDLLFTRQAL